MALSSHPLASFVGADEVFCIRHDCRTVELLVEGLAIQGTRRQMVAANALVYLPDEYGPILSSDATKEESANTCFVKGTFYETVVAGAMLNAAKHNWVIRLFCSTEEA